MKPIILITLSLISLPSHATCKTQKLLAQVLAAEGLNTPINDLAFLAKATLNRARNDNTSVCTLIRRGIVKAKSPPKDLAPYLTAVAGAALATHHDLTQGADSWNRGRRPSSAGTIKRQTKFHTYYKRKENS